MRLRELPTFYTLMAGTVLRVRSFGDLVVPREVPLPSRNEKALVRWAFQSLPWSCGFTWKLLYESGSMLSY